MADDKMTDTKSAAIVRDTGDRPQPTKRGAKKNQEVLVRQKEVDSVDDLSRSVEDIDVEDGGDKNNSHGEMKQSKSGFSIGGLFGKKKKDHNSEKDDATTKPKDAADSVKDSKKSKDKKDKDKEKSKEDRKSDPTLDKNKDNRRSDPALPRQQTAPQTTASPPHPQMRHQPLSVQTNMPPPQRFQAPPVRQPMMPVRYPLPPPPQPLQSMPQPNGISPVLLDPADPNALSGIVGIFNHGNTCYMNSVVQCIAHVDSIAHYFTSGLFLQDLSVGSVDKKGRKIVNDFKQDVTETFAQLVRSIWQNSYEKTMTEQFREACKGYREEFGGKDQQDAMDFLLFLMDTLHEELNGFKRLKQKNRIPPVVTDSYSFVEDHAQRNRSVIYQLFDAYQQSTLKCPHCQYSTTNIEPFTCLSLPIPAASTRAITVVYTDKQGRQMRHGFVVNMSEKVKFFREFLASEWKIADNKNIVLCEIGANGFQRTFRNADPMSVLVELGEGCALYAIHLPDPQLAEDSDDSSDDDGPAVRNLQMANGRKFQEQDLSYIRLVAVHCEKSDRHNELHRFSGPLHTEIHVQCTYTELKEALLTELEISGDLRKIKNKEDLQVEVHLVDAPADHSLIRPQVRSMPLIGHAVDRALNYNLADHGVRHLKMVVFWKQADRVRYAAEYEDEVEVDPSVQLMNSAEMEKPVNLQDCLQAYLSPNQFEMDDAWMCPRCRRRQQVDQSIKLWNTPDVLILQLKRFQTLGARRNKLTMFVRFPVESLDLTPYVEERNLGHLNQYCLSSIGRDASTPGDYLYDLIGVVNHTGSLQTGHYFSYILNPADRLWYRFSDQKVEPLSDMTAVCSSSAYILMYQRRTLRPIIMPNGMHWSVAGPMGMQPPMGMGMPMQGPPMGMPMQGLPMGMPPQNYSPNTSYNAGYPHNSQSFEDQPEGPGVQLRHNQRMPFPQQGMTMLPQGYMPQGYRQPGTMTMMGMPPLQLQPASITHDGNITTVKTGKATVHVPVAGNKRQGKWVWKGGQKVWDGPDPPPSTDSS